MSPVIIILCVISAVLAMTMLFTKSPITSALCLLGVLIMTAAIYGLIGEHMIATIQLVVYAGAIMVLFIFSIMLLNLTDGENDFKKSPAIFTGGVALGLMLCGFIMYALHKHFSTNGLTKNVGEFTPEKIAELGGNSQVLSHALFSQFYVSFEVMSLALLVALVGAVVLAKRKID
ncbi:MAG: NADH-quinone oxidoreductase subunit J [Bdellovibrionales bacterium]|nr:NADH-quinone oxidoreductase subunit J [Bdellovibrionales bacterium]